MKRRWFAVLGVFLFVSQGAAFVAFGSSAPDIETVLPLLPWMFGGVLFVLGGLSVRIGNVEWYQFVGAANVLMGIGFGIEFSLPALRDGSAAGPLLAIAGVVGGLSMIYIGVSWIRNSRQFSPSEYEGGPILASMNRNRT
jgi:hypothetical protein